jgi:hypothetical protein
LFGALEAPGDAVLPALGGQDASRDVEFGPQVVRVPAQVVDQGGALRDEALAVIDEQADVELAAREPRDWKGVESLADRGPRDRDGVDDVGLAALARGAARVGATRTTRSPRTSRKRSRAPDTCRQSSIAHTRSAPTPRAHRSRSSNERRLALVVRSAHARPVAASTTATVCERLWVSAPITIICPSPRWDY